MSIYGISSYLSNSGYNSSQFSNLKSSALANFKTTNTNVNSSMESIIGSKALTDAKGYKTALEKKYNSLTSDNADNSENEKALAKNAAALAKSSSSLAGSSEMFNVTDDEDKNNLTKSVSKFVSDYNNTISSLMKSDSETALKKGASMVTSTQAFSNALGRIGITIGKDNKLSVDETALKNADTGSIKSLFSGNYSYASKVSRKAEDISTAADTLSKSTYNNSGNLSYYNKVLSNSLFNESV